MDNQKKSKKSGCLLVVIIFIVLGLLGSCFAGKDDKKKDADSSTKNEQKVEEKNDETVNLNNVDPSSDKFVSSLKKSFGENLKIAYNKSTKVLDVTYPVKDEWNESSAVKNFAFTSAKIMKAVHKNPNINVINFNKEISMIDDKGNKSTENAIKASYTKEIMNQINFDNWVDMLYAKTNFAKFYGLADSYQVYPGILQGMKPEDRDALTSN